MQEVSEITTILPPLTVAAAALRLGVSKSQVYLWVRLGDLEKADVEGDGVVIVTAASVAALQEKRAAVKVEAEA